MDGFSTYLRKHFGPGEYLGVELEVNQKFPERGDSVEWMNLREGIGKSLQQVLENDLDL